MLWIECALRFVDWAILNPNQLAARYVFAKEQRLALGFTLTNGDLLIPVALLNVADLYK